MALRAGYYGLKRSIKNKLTLLAASMPADISPNNPIAGKNDVLTSITLLDDTVGWIGKNELINNAESKSVYGADFTVNSDKSILVNTPDKTTANVFYFINDFTLKAGTYILSGCPEGGSNTGYSLRITDGASVQDYGNGAEFTLSQDTPIKVRLVIGGGGNVTVTNKVFYPMICKKSLYILSPAYEQHHESVEEMLTTKTLTSADDIDSVLTEGWYKWSEGSIPAHWVANSWSAMRVISSIGAILQIGYTQNEIYIRRYGGSPASWGSWYKFTGTEVTLASLTKEEETKKATKKKVIKEEEE